MKTDDFGLRLELGGESLEQEENNTGAVEGKRESGALVGRFEEQGEGRGVAIWVRARNTMNMRVLRGQLLAHRSRMSKGEERHTLRKNWWQLVALVQFESRGLEVVEL